MFVHCLKWEQAIERDKANFTEQLFPKQWTKILEVAAEHVCQGVQPSKSHVNLAPLIVYLCTRSNGTIFTEFLGCRKCVTRDLCGEMSLVCLGAKAVIV